MPAQHHASVRGTNDTTLNAILGEDPSVAVHFGPGDKVEVRGPKDELERVKAQLLQVAERAEAEGVENSYVRQLGERLAFC